MKTPRLTIVLSIIGLLGMVGLAQTVRPGNAPAQAINTPVFDGTNWVARLGTSLLNFPTTLTTTARNLSGAAVVEKASRWSVIHNPAATSQATASIAAEAGVRHVADCLSFSADSGGAVTAANVVINLRDGATGAGTIIWTYVSSAPTAAALGLTEITPHSICGLSLVGTTNTAMTLEFSAGVTNLVEAVSLSGLNVN